MSYDASKYHQSLGADLNWLAYDLDGCLAEAIYPTPGIGEPIFETVAHLRMQKEYFGRKICIWTSRPWADYKPIKEWCADHNVPVDMIVCGKLLARTYYDDRAEFLPWINHPDEEVE